MTGMIGAVWGILGIGIILGSAICRLTPLAIAAFSFPFKWFHWAAWVAIVLLMIHAEGYRGFQMHFSPRVAARALYLRNHPRILHVILAPLFCIGYVHATPRRRMSSFALTGGIILLVFAVRVLPQPWRGIIDAGVVGGLAWGLASTFWFAAKNFATMESDHSPEIP
jgi:hypothetical protein